MELYRTRLFTTGAFEPISSAGSVELAIGRCLQRTICRKYESRVPNLLAHLLISCNNDFEGILALSSLRVVYRYSPEEDPLRADEAISVLHVFICSGLGTINRLGRGGGKKQSGRHHPPTLKSSLRASQICYYFLQGGLGKKVMRCQSLGGGGGGSMP